MITGADDRHDIAQIIYGLSIRGVRASVVENPSRGKEESRYLVLLDQPSEIKIRIARESIDAIWDAILGDFERAVTVSGRCAFCEYDVRGLPRPTTCPECGQNLDSIEARRAMRDRGF